MADSDFKKKYNECNKELQTAQTIISLLETDLTEYRFDLLSLQNNFDYVKVQRQLPSSMDTNALQAHQNARLTAEISGLRQQLEKQNEDQRKSRSELEKDNVKLEKQLNQSQDDVQRLTAEISDLRQQLEKQNEDQRKSRTDLLLKKDDQLQAFVTLANKISELEKDKVKLETQLNQSVDDVNRFEPDDDKNKLQEQLQKAQDECYRLKKEIEVHISSAEDNVTAVHELEKRKRFELEEDRHQLQELLKKSQDECQRLGKEIEVHTSTDECNDPDDDEIEERESISTAQMMASGGGYSVHDKKSKSLVVAIDIGTTYTGYAFSWKDDYNTDPTKSVNPNWNCSMSLMTPKAPTCVLFNPNKEFHSFGYDAENVYSELAIVEEHLGWYFFRRFKMRLHDKKIHRDFEIEDDKGNKMPAMTVFAEVIRYIKGHIFDLMENRCTLISEDDVHFVLTVPAIWTDSAKQFMREAAYQGGIDGGQLSIALEPEAASLFCQHINTEKLIGSEGAKFAVASTGTKYMVIDLGGGTADITIHERESCGRLKEVHKASGGAWGGTKIDEEFYKLLIAIVGASKFKKFCDSNKEDQLDLQRELEIKKRTITPGMKGKITVKVPVAIKDTFEEDGEETVKEAIENSPYAGKISWLNDKLRIDADLFKGLFQSCTNHITRHVTDLLKKPAIQGTNIFLMVGGFSESIMMQDALTQEIKRVLPNGKVIIPEEAGLSVLKGGVIFGHRPIAITHRVSKYTYGINISPPFDAEKHPEDHKVCVGGFDRCRDVFKRYIQEGETLGIGKAKYEKHISLMANQKEIILKLFASPRNDPKFVDEDDCELLGNVIVNLPDTKDRIRVKVRMMFGETEIAVEAEELAKNTKIMAKFDFL